MVMIDWILAIFVVLLIAYVVGRWCITSSLPTAYTYGAGTPVVTILAGTHGDEPGPAHMLQSLIDSGEIRSLLPDRGTYYVVPYVNRDAIVRNQRHTWWQPDINRSYPDGTPINRAVLPYVDGADLVVDLHEARGFHRTSGSLGQTVTTNVARLRPLVDAVVAETNGQISLPPHAKWGRNRRRRRLPGSLKEYRSSPLRPYILVEVSGQDAGIPLESRIQQSRVLLRSLLHEYVASFQP